MLASHLSTLEKLRETFGPDACEHKHALLGMLTSSRLPSASHVSRLHEQLCFMRAYPDSRPVLQRVESMLEEFPQRADLKRGRDELWDTGIAGTAIHFRFFWLTAQWLAERWPERLTIDWAELANDEALTDALPLLVSYPERSALIEKHMPAQEWLEQMKPADQTDATFLIQRVAAMRCSPDQRRHFFETLDLPMRLAPGPRPSRSAAKWTGAKISYQTDTRTTHRPNLSHAARAEPLDVKRVSPRQGRFFINQARETMLVRSRDLDAIAWADPKDVSLVDWGNGLQFAWLGMRPEHRPLFEGLYVYITLKNGVPIGYVQAAALFGSAFINYNVFPPWRGAEAAMIYGQALATARHVLGLDTFAIDVYQLGGDGNQEALESGAWWFYYKMGFRPRNAEVKRVVRAELSRMQKRAGHRSSVATLEALAEAELFLHLESKRDDVVGVINFGAVGLQVMHYLADRFGTEREAGLETCAREAAAVLGIRDATLRQLSPHEKRAWRRWSPLVLMLEGVARWSPRDKQALFEVARAKGGARESDFVRRFDGHTKLRKAFLKLAAK